MVDSSQTMADREAVLVELYERANANPIEVVPASSLAAGTGLSDDRIQTALFVLKDLGLVEFRTMGPTVSITARGIEHVEQLRSPSAAAEVLAVLSVAELRQTEAQIDALRKALDEADLDDQTRQILIVDLDTAANQIKSPQPSRHIVRAIWTRIEAVLINVGAAVLTRYIPPF